MSFDHSHRRTVRAIAGRSFLLSIAFCCALQARAQKVAGTASLYGTVRDPQGKPIAAATVRLQFTRDVKAVTTETNDQGQYRFVWLPSGVYSLQAASSGYKKAEIPSVFLSTSESKAFDLTLERDTATSSAPAAPQFFDPPQFTVSGVTDTTSLGGHGSDTVVRARDSIARETASLGKPSPNSPSEDATEVSLRKQAEREPENFAAIHTLGAILLKHGREHEAISFLKHASELNPGDEENGFDLALAYSRIGDYAQARAITEPMLARRDTAPLHHLEADIQEKSGNSLAAALEYQRAAQLDPSEPNLFDWGSELLLHHAPEPAEQVFTNGSKLYPGSTRMLIGLGAAEFAAGSTEKAVEQLCAAADLNVNDPAPYLFLGRIQSAGNSSSDGLIERLRRFATLHPDNAQANYYYAVALWKRSKNQGTREADAQIESLLNRAVRLDPNLAEAYLQLGILHSEERKLSNATSEFQQAVKLSPKLEEAHYRLVQVYRETGQSDRAKAELQVYQQLEQESAQNDERERHEIQQFVYTLRDPSSSQAR
ncbi:MAG TPA: tetratricopeptide repeat protein [Candidatus Sulfotelmatobacter sp.]|nr:tetratricopeptide repeat protein [Candidatus Sulfotelmatobacter sp.]